MVRYAASAAARGRRREAVRAYEGRFKRARRFMDLATRHRLIAPAFRGRRSRAAAIMREFRSSRRRDDVRFAPQCQSGAPRERYTHVRQSASPRGTRRVLGERVVQRSRGARHIRRRRPSICLTNATSGHLARMPATDVHGGVIVQSVCFLQEHAAAGSGGAGWRSVRATAGRERR